MQGVQDRAEQAAGQGQPVPNLQHLLLSHLGSQGRRAGSRGEPRPGGSQEVWR